MERLEFLKRCEEILELSSNLAQTENDEMIERQLEPIITIVGRKEDISRIFLKEAIHKLQYGDILASRIVNGVDSDCIRGIAIWREKEET